MPIQQDFLSYHKSIGLQIRAEEKRIRDLIGASHWATDGAHKEGILKKIIENYAPEIFRVGTGFVCYPAPTEASSQNSSQIDILITAKDSPTLYKSGGLQIVTPECVRAVIEVKSGVANGRGLDSIIQCLSEYVREIRARSSLACWAGLFIYNEHRLTDRDVLDALQRVCAGNVNSAINCIAVGDSVFVRFWSNGQHGSGLSQAPVWHSYQLQDLAKAYFVSNIVSHLSPGINPNSSDAWFPIQGTKEVHRVNYAMLSEIGVVPFTGG